MRITLNSKEKLVMKKYHRINLTILCLPEDYFGHYWIKANKNGAFILAKKSGLNKDVMRKC